MTNFNSLSSLDGESLKYVSSDHAFYDKQCLTMRCNSMLELLKRNPNVQIDHPDFNLPPIFCLPIIIECMHERSRAAFCRDEELIPHWDDLWNKYLEQHSIIAASRGLLRLWHYVYFSNTPLLLSSLYNIYIDLYIKGEKEAAVVDETVANLNAPISPLPEPALKSVQVLNSSPSIFPEIEASLSPHNPKILKRKIGAIISQAEESPNAMHSLLLNHDDDDDDDIIIVSKKPAPRLSQFRKEQILEKSLKKKKSQAIEKGQFVDLTKHASSSSSDDVTIVRQSSIFKEKPLRKKE
jgi:hypothetical protein